MAERLAWGIIGAGQIAKAFARGVQRSKTGELVAIGSRSQEKAEAFGNELNVPVRHGSYEALLADARVAAVYIATPHPMHVEWVVKAADAGKHILVEKPIGMNAAEAMVAIEAARRNNVFLMEAFMYLCHPQTAKIVELIQSKAIGQVKSIQATFSFHWPKPFNAESRLTNAALGGGGILDVGCYPISFCRLIAGVARGSTGFEDPVEVKAVGHLESSGVDGYTAAVLRFGEILIAEVATGVQLGQDNVARIYGTEGWIEVPDPWVPSKEGGQTKILVKSDGKTQEIVVDSPEPIYSLEADVVGENLARRQAPPPAMNWAGSIGNMRVLDRWRQQIGLVYESEKLANLQPPAWRAVRVRPQPKHKMKYGRIPGVDRPISRVALGADFSSDAPREAMVIFDDFFEQGGNLFDTAFIYGGAKPERSSDAVLGHWVCSRGLRQQVVILGKGAHTPDCDPAGLSKQLLQSLETSGLEYFDIYNLHRDNLEIPVGEFIDVLNEHLAAGRIRSFGGSNWSLRRIEQANQYARSQGLTGMTSVSNNFSLAEMVVPAMERVRWVFRCGQPGVAGKIANGADSVEQPGARLFRAGAGGAGEREDAELVRCWYSPGNFRRLERAKELAKQKGVETINIALAYVLCQPFPTFPLIGPRQISETHSSLAALEVNLTAKELKWLNLEE